MWSIKLLGNFHICPTTRAGAGHRPVGKQSLHGLSLHTDSPYLRPGYSLNALTANCAAGLFQHVFLFMTPVSPPKLPYLVLFLALRGVWNHQPHFTVPFLFKLSYVMCFMMYCSSIEETHSLTEIGGGETLKGSKISYSDYTGFFRAAKSYHVYEMICFNSGETMGGNSVKPGSCKRNEIPT